MHFTNSTLLRLSLLGLISLASCFGLSGSCLRQTAETSEQQIKVKLTCDTPNVRVGDGIDLKAEIVNVGPTTVFVAKELNGAGNAISKLNLYLEVGSQLQPPMTHTAADSVPGRKEPFANLFAKFWVALAPAHFYGGNLYMSSSDFPRLNIPGRYKIRGEYISRGFYLPTPNNPLQSYIEELKALPYKPWEGLVETNSIWIDVRPKK